SHQLGKHWVTIGRAPGNLFQIPESSVSGQHCEVLWRDNRLLVRDMRSTNGTFIKGAMITEGLLRPGEVMQLGDIEVQLEESEANVIPLSLGGNSYEKEAGEPATCT